MSVDAPSTRARDEGRSKVNANAASAIMVTGAPKPLPDLSRQLER
jgi:hypothetical protein